MTFDERLAVLVMDSGPCRIGGIECVRLTPLASQIFVQDIDHWRTTAATPPMRWVLQCLMSIHLVTIALCQKNLSSYGLTKAL